jgi:hypothetical protein
VRKIAACGIVSGLGEFIANERDAPIKMPGVRRLRGRWPSLGLTSQFEEEHEMKGRFWHIAAQDVCTARPQLAKADTTFQAHPIRWSTD